MSASKNKQSISAKRTSNYMHPQSSEDARPNGNTLLQSLQKNIGKIGLVAGGAALLVSGIEHAHSIPSSSTSSEANQDPRAEDSKAIARHPFNHPSIKKVSVSNDASRTPGAKGLLVTVSLPEDAANKHLRDKYPSSDENKSIVWKSPVIETGTLKTVAGKGKVTNLGVIPVYGAPDDPNTSSPVVRDLETSKLKQVASVDEEGGNFTVEVDVPEATNPGTKLPLVAESQNSWITPSSEHTVGHDTVGVETIGTLVFQNDGKWGIDPTQPPLEDYSTTLDNASY